MSKKKRKPPSSSPSSVAFKCGACGAPISVTLHGTEAVPTRVDCPACKTRDAALPA